MKNNKTINQILQTEVCKYCHKHAIYIVEDNEPLRGMQLICAEHLQNAIRNAFGFNEFNKPEDDIVFVRRIDRLNNKERNNYYLRQKK